MSPALRWVLLALAGLLVAFGVGLLASNLASRQIGLANEPLQAGEVLAPPERGERPRDTRRDQRSGRRAEQTEATTTTTLPPTASTTTAIAPPPVTTTSAPVTPSGSGGRGEHEGPDD